MDPVRSRFARKHGTDPSHSGSTRPGRGNDEGCSERRITCRNRKICALPRPTIPKPGAEAKRTARIAVPNVSRKTLHPTNPPDYFTVCCRRKPSKTEAWTPRTHKRQCSALYRPAGASRSASPRRMGAIRWNWGLGQGAGEQLQPRLESESFLSLRTSSLHL